MGGNILFDFFTKIEEDKARLISPVTLAFVGDAVYSLFVREREVLNADGKLALMQKRTSATVSAKGQSELLLKLEDKFTETEADVFRRGRNAKKGTKSKNASVADYNRSTGFEAVLGYLYLSGQYDRISFLLSEDSQ